jgi:hypothetical protein
LPRIAVGKRVPVQYNEEFAPTSAERIARNDGIFREANEAIAESADDMDIEGGIPFLCECAEPTCTKIVRMTLDEYAQIRSDPTHFVNAAGHEVAARGWGEVIAETNGYVVVQKLGRAAEVVTEMAEGDDRR